MSNSFQVESHRGPYRVEFISEAFSPLTGPIASNCHFVVDKNVARLYEKELQKVLGSPSVLQIEATEQAKSLDRFSPYISHLVDRQIRKNDTLIAIGGGVTQDIVAFLAATLLRGLAWEFYPTTLLAQADSCIGSKSSINVGEAKNILGTFTPPRKIYISTSVLKTLTPKDLCSGLGEILKVHAIDGPSSFEAIANDYDQVLENQTLLERYIWQSLQFKKKWIELDEFDTGPRNVMNYGHSFGHAIESATHYAVPHGIAVSVGMDMANFVALRMGRIDQPRYDHMHTILVKNYRDFRHTQVPLESFFAALKKDKKNIKTSFRLILLNATGVPESMTQEDTSAFREICQDFFRICLSAT